MAMVGKMVATFLAVTALPGPLNATITSACTRNREGGDVTPRTHRWHDARWRVAGGGYLEGYDEEDPEAVKGVVEVEEGAPLCEQSFGEALLGAKHARGFHIRSLERDLLLVRVVATLKLSSGSG